MFKLLRKKTQYRWAMPRRLASLLPPKDMIEIKRRDSTSIEYCCKYFREDTYEQRKQRTKTVFTYTYHPFIRRFSGDLQICCSKLLNSIKEYNPFAYSITKDQIQVYFDASYYSSKLTETQYLVHYSESYQESWHDGGGSGSVDWYLYPSNKTTEGQSLCYDNNLRTDYVSLPACKCYWRENEHLYLQDPWDIPGVFEYCCVVFGKSYYDSPGEYCTNGVEPETK